MNEHQLRSYILGMMLRLCACLRMSFAFIALVSWPLEADERLPNFIIILTDDHGYADLGVQDIVDDIRTPHIDALAKSGVRFTNGYITGPQCVPSRGGLITGQYQNRFGLESNLELKDEMVLKRFSESTTIAERLRSAGYTTGMAGKWHLGAGIHVGNYGFDHFYAKNSGRPAGANFRSSGESVEPQEIRETGYHLDLCSDTAVSFIKRFHEEPFFFYLSYRAPHVPLDAPQKYLDRFPGEMKERRRQALAMMSAVDDGVGRVVATLDDLELRDETLIFFLSDNGAPLKIYQYDRPGSGPGWDGSLNTPMNGEKGMLSEGGIRVPFVASWPGNIPSGEVYDHPVISLDMAASFYAAAGLPPEASADGVDLIPYLKGENQARPHEALFWRWLGQCAVRVGDWKYLQMDERSYLYDLTKDPSETKNLIEEFPDQAAALYQRLESWAQELSPPGIGVFKSEGMSRSADEYARWYLEGERDFDTPFADRASGRSKGKK